MNHAQRISGLVLLGFFLAVVAVGFAGMSRHRALQADAAVAEEQIALLRARLNAAGDGAHDADANGQSDFLVGTTASLAGSTLKTLLADMVTAGGTAIDSFEYLQTGEEADQTVAIRLSFDAENDALQAILFAIEQARPAMFVRSLQVSSVEEDPSEVMVAPRALRVVLVVEGYRRLST